MKTRILRTIANQIIIGNITESSDKYIIEVPYVVIPTQEGIQIYPFDAEIIGEDLDVMEVAKINVLYCTTAGEALQNAYTTATTGIELPTNQLII